MTQRSGGQLPRDRGGGANAEVGASAEGHVGSPRLHEPCSGCVFLLEHSDRGVHERDAVSRTLHADRGRAQVDRGARASAHPTGKAQDQVGTGRIPGRRRSWATDPAGSNRSDRRPHRFPAMGIDRITSAWGRESRVGPPRYCWSAANRRLPIAPGGSVSTNAARKLPCTLLRIPPGGPLRREPLLGSTPSSQTRGPTAPSSTPS